MKLIIFLLALNFEVREYCSSLYDFPVPKIIEKYGYPSETHSLYTADDYYLILHRIPHGRHRQKGHKVSVIVGHGMFESSLNWLLMGPERSLGFLLADDGYDVWLANSRGNCYSKDHKYLKTNESKYWDFSYHEMGFYDVSATVDYILNITNKSSVLYIGHSQSSTAGLVSAIEHPEIKIKAYFLMAPVSYLAKSLSPARGIMRVEFILNHLIRKVGHFEFSSSFGPPTEGQSVICAVVPEICGIETSAFCGQETLYYNESALAVQETKWCGVSSKQLLHYLQGFNLDFSKFNYGILENWKKYGSISSPRYKVENINKPVYLYHGRKDLCADIPGVEILAKKLKNNLTNIHLVDDLNFDHRAFTYHVRAKELVYDILMSHMRRALN